MNTNYSPRFQYIGTLTHRDYRDGAHYALQAYKDTHTRRAYCHFDGAWWQIVAIGDGYGLALPCGLDSAASAALHQITPPAPVRVFGSTARTA